MEPITTAASLLLSKIVLDKFYEGVSSKLGEKVVEKAIAPIEALGKFVWGRCVKLAKDPKKATEVLQAAANGSETAKQSIVAGVDSILNNDEVAAEVQKLAAEVYQVINIDEMSGGEIWNVFGGKAEKNEFKQNQGPIYKDSTINNH
jgi:hypothetical protein